SCLHHFFGIYDLFSFYSKWAKEDAQKIVMFLSTHNMTTGVSAYVGLGMGLAQGDGPRKKKRRTTVAHYRNFTYLW
ncbi:hypothetical protein ACJX0J_006546, partial [Zea mays]